MSVSGQVVNGPFRRSKMLCHSDFVFRVMQCPSFPSLDEALNPSSPEIVTHYLYFKHYPMGGFWFYETGAVPIQVVGHSGPLEELRRPDIESYIVDDEVDKRLVG